MLSFLNRFNTGAWYWLLLVFVGLALEAGALYYQYVLEYGPCILCIHVRLWVLAVVIISVFGLIFRHSRGARIIFNLLNLVAVFGLLERSWKTLGVERGWVIDECNMDLGLPDWFAVDQWLPFLLEAVEPCGYTPYIIFRITMAETLVAIGIAAVVVALLVVIASLKPQES